MSSVLILYRLQKIDSQMDQVKNRLLAIDKLLNEDLAFRTAQQELADVEHALYKAQRGLKQTEDIVQTQQIKIEENEAALYGGRIRNPKELQDLQNDVASLKKYLRELENQQLDAMILLEQAEKEVTDKQAELKTVEGQHTAKNATQLGAKLTLQKEVERLDAERKAVVASISPEEIKIYERLRQQKRGIAVSPISDGSCEACGSTLTPADWQIARSPSKVSYCPTCGRIIYAG